jgi:DMSO/TMAO reductase YedYZ molybdopterin-dependent catalytic subunit
MGRLVCRYATETFPALVVCAGNRRKEQNMIKKSIGFNWGPCGIGNTMWKGVPLRLLLNRAGIFKPGPGARFVCLAGPEGELPKSYPDQDGGPGSYGTSIDMETALDPTCDVIVAFEQNGKKLHPDHGYPCRVLIPVRGHFVSCWVCEFVCCEIFLCVVDCSVCCV